jgi:hypothetical protein
MEEQAILIELEPSGEGTCPAGQTQRRKAEGAPKIKRIDQMFHLPRRTDPLAVCAAW